MQNRFWLYAPFAILATITAIWSGIWYYAASKTEAVIASSIEHEAKNDRDWTCPNRRVTGFPFRIEITCDAPSFRSKQEGRPGSGSLMGLSIQARVADPTRAIATFVGPLKLEIAGRSLLLNWTEAKTSLSADSKTLNDFTLDLRNVTMALNSGQDAPVLGGAQRVNINLAQDKGLAQDKSLSPELVPFKLLTKLEGVTFATLDMLSGNAQPLTLELQAVATNVPLKPNPDWRKMLDNWRQSGGILSIVLLDVTKGNLHLDTKGDLALDDSRRPSGRLAANFQGLDKLLGRMGAGGFSGVFSGGKLTLNLQNGKIMVGPIPVAPIQPLY